MKHAGWFRFYERMIDSPEVLQLTDSEFRLVVSLWCLASSAGQDGYLPYTALLLRRRCLPDRTPAEVGEMLAHLIALDLVAIQGEGYQITRWTEHQYTYESWKPAARAAQKRKERTKSTPSLPPTPSLTPAQEPEGYVASVSQAGSNVDTDTDTDTDHTPLPPTEPLTKQPAPKAGVGFDFPGLWAGVAAHLGYKPTWNYTQETAAVKRLLSAYPTARAPDFVRFLGYVGTLWPFSNDPERQPSFSDGAKHFGKWFAGGQPAAAEPPKAPTNGHAPRAAPHYPDARDILASLEAAR